MKVLILGSGGREHALVHAIAKNMVLKELIVAPGNPGIGQSARLAPVDPMDIAAVVALAKEEAVDLVVVGPEAPLVAGVADALRAEGIAVYGPSKAAAQLEGSKYFTKELCREKSIPTAAWGRFRMPEAAIAFIRARGAPIVVKADGLAAGKGVVVAQTLQEAEDAVREILGGRFGEAGSSVVVEEFLDGEEVSFFALCDGTRALPLGSAQDHKRVGEGDSGPNTGGMGAYSPAPIMTPALEARVMKEIIEPALEGMKARGTPFSGTLFAGLMIGKDGAPKLIEFNARFGDPETQAILPRLDVDLLSLLLGSAHGDLAGAQVTLKPQAALTVVMAAKGYPDAPQKGAPIGGVEAAEQTGAIVTHAGTATAEGQLVASGGRVLNVTGLGADVKAAQDKAYAGVAQIDAPGLFFRRDIGWRAVGASSGAVAAAAGVAAALASAEAGADEVHADVDGAQAGAAEAKAEAESAQAASDEPQAGADDAKAEAGGAAAGADGVGKAGSEAVAAALLDLDLDFEETEAPLTA